MKTTRRGFLTLTGAAAGLSLFPADFQELLRLFSSNGQEWPGPAVETWKRSVCQLCPGGCGIKARLLDDWPVKINASPDHPISRGGLCPKGEAALQVLYDPDRIRRPLKRAGQRGEGKWTEISWDEAIRTLTSRLGGLRREGRPEGLVVIGGQYRGLIRALWDRFLEAYGSPNYVSTAFGCEASDAVLRLTQGVRGHIAYDLEHADYLLSFGTSLLDGGWSPVWQMRSIAELRQGRPGRRAKLVQADTRFSMTAAKADEWLPVRPGSDGALALGIAHVLISERLYDEKFLREHTLGFDDWTDASGVRHEGFRTIVLRDYPPKVASSASGVPEETIVRVAREFGNARPAVALADHGATRYSNGLFISWAVHCLNALAGSIDVPGGVLTAPAIAFTPMPPPQVDPVAEQGRRRPRLDGAQMQAGSLVSTAVQRLPEAIRTGRPYPVEAVLLYYANPAFSLPGSLGMREALARVPFVVSFSPNLDESTDAADLVLPDHIFLERWEDDPTPPGVPFPVLGLRQPVRAPLYDTRATSDVVLAVAKALGDPLSASLPWENTEAFLKERIQGVYESGRGVLGRVPGAPPESSSPSGTESKRPETFEAFWEQLVEQGVWSDPEYPFRDWGRTLSTPSGRFEFLPEPIGSALNGGASATSLSLTPHRLGDEQRYPFALNVFRPLAYGGGRTANVPYLLQIAGKTVSALQEAWVEINPSTARALGIADGDPVWVESPLGKVRAHARLHPGTPPEVVNMPSGAGHRTGGRWAKNFGVNPNVLLGSATMALTGGPAYQVTRVRVTRA